MTETLTAPPAVIDYQAVAIGNIRMMLSLRGLKQSDLAAYMGKHRQNLNRMINTGAQWSFTFMTPPPRLGECPPATGRGCGP